jgi:FAD/FMN-containing dehydrogenase
MRNGAALELMRSVKRRFDSAGVCNPGVFVGGI